MLYVALAIAAISFIYPFIWMMGAAFAPMHEISKMVIWPAHPGWGNFKYMIEKIPILHALIISLMLATVTTSLVLITGSTVGYALAKMRFRGRQTIFYVIVFTMSLPFQITLIPNYITMVNLTPGGYLPGADTAICSKRLCRTHVQAGFPGSSTGID